MFAHNGPMARRYDLTSLELFVAVCDAKSISKAAEAQSIAASAISKRITQLEDISGAALLTRARSGVAPTAAGLTLLEHARNVLHNIDLIDRDLASDARGLRGYIRVFANASAIAEFLPASIVSFLADPKHADIDVHIEEMSSADVISGVRDGLAAIGICRSESQAERPRMNSVPERSACVHRPGKTSTGRKEASRLRRHARLRACGPALGVESA